MVNAKKLYEKSKPYFAKSKAFIRRWFEKSRTLCKKAFRYGKTYGKKAVIRSKQFVKKIAAHSVVIGRKVYAGGKSLYEKIIKKLKERNAKVNYLERRSLPVKNLILLCVLGFSIIVTVFAWFSNKDTATASQVNITVTAGDNLEISLDQGADKTYHNKLDLNDYLGLVKDLQMLDLTSDGKTFIRPALDQVDGLAVINMDREWITPEAGKEYISFDLFLRSNKAFDVYLEKGSSVVPTVGYNNLVWPDADNKFEMSRNYNGSSYGDFSKDCIIGAARVSFLDAYNTETQDYDLTRFVWIPNPQIYLDSDTWTVNTNVADNTYGTFIHRYYDTGKTLFTCPEEKTVTSLSAQTGNKPSTEKTQLTTLEQGTDDDGYYYSRVKVNVWIDGNDTEARRALDGGMFNINLKVIGFEQ